MLLNEYEQLEKIKKRHWQVSNNNFKTYIQDKWYKWTRRKNKNIHWQVSNNNFKITCKMKKKMEMKKKHWTIDKWTTTLKQMQHEHLTKHTLTYEQQQWEQSENESTCKS